MPRNNTISSLPKKYFGSLLFVFFVFSLLSHYEAQRPFEWLASQFGHEQLYLAIGVVVICSVFIIGLRLWRGLLSNSRIKELTPYWIYIIALLGLCYFTIMPYKTEAMHFFQYAIMGFLSYGLLRNAFGAVNLAFFFGFIDELFQYTWGQSVYLDFNDIILNFVGSFIGVLLYISFNRSAFDPRWNKLYLLNLLTGSFLVLGLLTGLICFFSDGDCPLYLCEWDSSRLGSDFWDSAWDHPWHRVRPIPGSLAIIFLPLTSWFLNKQ